MAQILATGLFADATKVEFVQQDPAARIPNITTDKVDITIQFMTISSNRAQLVNFSRPYYVEGVALLTLPGADGKNFDQLKAMGTAARVSILQNVGAEEGVHEVLPEAVVIQLDTQANVIQALESQRVDAAAVDLSTVRWMVARTPDKYADAGKWWRTMLYGAALPQRRSRLADLRQPVLRLRHVRPRERALLPRLQEVLRPGCACAHAGLPVHLRPAHRESSRQGRAALARSSGEARARCSIISISGSSGGTSTSSAGACC